ncbi:hypothetical protein [Roseicella aerolata]|uniref:Uncharacterized protein n=1 Tax=Roseicella aerolata TaxID=2883479 RepID=A0A9X1IC82_9PROT|nr:hypothetical protein [Roseicella aerolata]MCB4820678.1 hypothetical protein [Roseicella aerolata]
MARSTAFQSLAFLGALAAAPAAALAQAPLDGGSLPVRAGNVIGGGSASLSGGGDDRTITYGGGGAGGGATQEQPGRVATFGGNNGGSPYWIYGAPAPGGMGREAWLLGGGEDAQVMYTSPRGMGRR